MEIENWKNGLTVCYENIIELIRDAYILIENGRYVRACFLLITAFEELAVGYFILENYNDPKPEKLKKVLKHKEKLAISSFITFPYSFNLNLWMNYSNRFKNLNLKNFKLDTDDITNTKWFRFGNDIQKEESLFSIRNRSLYTQPNESNSRFTSPKDISAEVAYDVALVLYNKLSITLPSFSLQINCVDDPEESTIGILHYDDEGLEFIKSLSLIFQFLKVIESGSLERIIRFKGASPFLKDDAIDSILDPKKLDDRDFLKEFTTELFKDFSKKFEQIFESKDSRKDFKSFTNLIKVFNPELAEFIKKTFKFYIKIAKGTIKSKDIEYLIYFNE